MLKKPSKPLFRVLVNEVSQDPRFPFWFAILVHFVSNVQVLFVIFQPTLNPEYRINLRALKFVRVVSAYTVGFDIFDTATDSTLVEVIWYIICFYLSIFSIVWLITLYLCSRKRKISPLLTTGIGALHFLHAKILFCPIHYYLVWVTSYRYDCDEVTDLGDAICGLSYFSVSVIFIVINGVISLSKELLPRQSKKSEDAFAMKNNFFYQAILLHKTMLIIFLMTLQSSKFVLSIFNFLFPLIYSFTLLAGLPYYNILTMKINLFFVSCHVTFSLILMVIFFEVDPIYLESVSVVLLAYLTKSFWAYLNRTLIGLSHLISGHHKRLHMRQC